MEIYSCSKGTDPLILYLAFGWTCMIKFTFSAVIILSLLTQVGGSVGSKALLGGFPV
jgi:hypothetical protein